MARRNFTPKTLDLFTPTLIPLSLPEVFKQIHYYLYSNSNIPRAERLGAEMVRILFCKIFDETHNRGGKEFVIRPNEGSQAIGGRIRRLFEKVKDSYPDVFGKEEKIYLDEESIRYVVEKLQNYVLTETERDVIGEAFQAFWGPGLRGEKGQFFTPRNVVRLCVEMLNPEPGERIIDPACGSGGFLVEVLSHLRGSFYNVYGIDKEIDLVKICKAYMAIVGDGYTNIFCADSLYPESWSESMREVIADESFDVVLTNPPFGARIFIEDQRILKGYELGHKWVKERTDKWRITNSVSKQVPQILFIERCLRLLKPGGRMAIVLPDGVFGNPSDRYVWEFILEIARILAIISLPPETFLPSTHTKTSVLFLEKTGNNGGDYEIFMGIADKVGHDKNGKMIFKMDRNGNYILDSGGNKIVDDDLPLITSKYRELLENGTVQQTSRLGFTVKFSEIRNYVFIPGYYDPEIKQKLKEMEETDEYRLRTIKELVEQGLISIKRGHEVGSKYYGMGEIPFVRTSDIVNWEIKIDPVKCIPEEIYEKYRERQDIKENDVLLVTDGTFLIGRTAIVTPFDEKIVIQSHIRRIRCLKPDQLHPYLLLYLLNTEIVQKQIEEKTFVQATISTLGDRLYEIVLPLPTDKETVSRIINEVSQIIRMKMEARKKMDDLMRSGKEW
ncbi:MAG TPA: methyltransferase domain-containing protein [Armatimonadetes bacterium]|nr:methyltransferase domain-containing protein [Armatimonadota bacterium]